MDPQETDIIQATTPQELKEKLDAIISDGSVINIVIACVSPRTSYVVIHTPS